QRLALAHAELAADRPGQRPIGAAGEDQQVAVLVLHLRRAPLRSDRCGGGWVEPGLGSGDWGPKAKALAPAPDPSPRIPNFCWQGRQDSNLRMPGSKPGALGLLATPLQWNRDSGFGIRDSQEPTSTRTADAAH